MILNLQMDSRCDMIFCAPIVHVYATAMSTFVHYPKLSKTDINNGSFLLFQQIYMVGFLVRVRYWLNSSNAERKKPMHSPPITHAFAARAIYDGINSSDCETNIMRWLRESKPGKKHYQCPFLMRNKAQVCDCIFVCGIATHLLINTLINIMQLIEADTDVRLAILPQKIIIIF